jgi:hypothetical protein
MFFRRNNYVTPTSYLELINTYKSLLSVKRDQVNLQIKRYTGGLGALLLAGNYSDLTSVLDKVLDFLPSSFLDLQKQASIP